MLVISMTAAFADAELNITSTGLALRGIPHISTQSHGALTQVTAGSHPHHVRDIYLNDSVAELPFALLLQAFFLSTLSSGLIRFSGWKAYLWIIGSKQNDAS